jgi:hypothetical protein
MPSSSSPPSLNRGGKLLGVNLLSHLSGELRNGPRIVPYEIHIQNPSNERTREAEFSMTFSVHSESRKTTETLDLLKAFGRYPTQDSAANLAEIPGQAASPEKTMQIDESRVPVENKRRILSIDPAHTPQDSSKTFENQIQAPVTKKPRMTPDASASFDKKLESDVSSDRAARIDRTPVQIEKMVEPEGIVTGIGPNLQGDIALESQPSNNGDDNLLRLEFTHEILKTHNPLIEDILVIEEIKKLNEHPKIYISESNFNNALKIIGKSARIMKRDGPIEIRSRYPHCNPKSPRNCYVESQFETLINNNDAWIAFWNQRTKINLEKVIPKKTPKFKKVFPLFLFYVEMIDAIFPKIEGTSPNEHDEKLLESAIKVIQTIQRRNLTKQELIKSQVAITGHDILTNVGHGLNTLLWRCLKVWIHKSGRQNTLETFCNSTQIMNFEIFINKIFCLSIENFHIKLLKRSASFHQSM